ncbi:MAG: FAD-dependent oxidoreductase, partial [Phaeodactylibacter sp.]|nr:FAD-dependent oxidoreductase [Phaeodactylibacter sp.]
IYSFETAFCWALTMYIMTEKQNNYDIVVVGGTPAGIISAVAAARLGATVALVEYHDHIGGMSTSGLGKSDIENKDAISGLFREFTSRVREYYTNKYGEGSKNVELCRDGYYYEPSVAERVFNEMIGEEKSISLLPGYQIESARTESEVLVEAGFKNRRNKASLKLQAQVFIDATYEGDLYALAGADYHLGREGREVFGEPHAGKIFFDHNEHIILPGSTGEGDDNLPAYTYRLCLTDDPENSYVLKEPPSGYERENYTAYLSDLKEGRLGGPKELREGHGYYPAHFNTMLRVFSFAEIPNRKYDVNINPRALGFPFPEENRDYVEADWEQRERVFQRHRELVLGLLYFVQNDPEVPAEHRKMANEYHLPLDEFTDNGHFPWQLYVREARRLKGKYILTENDLNRPNAESRSAVFPDSIIAGEFPIDSFPVTRESSSGKEVLEGYICLLEILPYQVPLRIMLPEKIGQLIVPVAASTSHVAYSTIRMEPQWMGMGQAAGTLAQLAVSLQRKAEEVPVSLLQQALLENGQVLTLFDDLDPGDKACRAAQFWGTRGFFPAYTAALRKPLQKEVLEHWLEIFLAETGRSSGSRVWEEENLTHAGFGRLIRNLEEETGISGSAKMEPLDWKYGSGGPYSPVLRGEACMAFFQLYVILTKELNVNVQDTSGL